MSPNNETNQDSTKNSTILYTSGAGNKAIVSKVDANGNLIRHLQWLDPIVDPLPDELPANVKPGQKFATEWLSKHPKYNLLFSLTSFWDRAEAVLTTFRILGQDKDEGNDDEEAGTLQKIGSCRTGGFQACQGVFSPDGNTYVVPHHNGGKIAFFDVSKDEAPNAPLRVIDLPERVPGTRVEPQNDKLGMGMPSCHGVCYAPGVPDASYILAVDPMQDMVVTYNVNEQGRLLVEEEENKELHASTLYCPVQHCYSGWFQETMMKNLVGNATRPRRAVVHPTGKFMYVLSERYNCIQVFALDEHGKAGEQALQELKITKTDASRFWVGPAITIASEMEATESGLIVSVRGFSVAGPLGRFDSGLYLVDFAQPDGSQLKLTTAIPIPGMIRHFLRQEDVLWVGVENKNTIQKYKLTRDADSGARTAKLLGECLVDNTVMCIATP